MTEGSSETGKEVEGTSGEEDFLIDKQIKELKHDFHDVLSEQPDVLKYIERLHTIIRRQQKKLNKCYKKLKDHRISRKPTESKEIQTSEESVGWGGALENTQKDFSEEVKEVAENAMKKTGFVYEPVSGMYYDYSTGYYYNAELRMYYDGNTGHYLEYDEETKSYKYHSTVISEQKSTDDNNTSHKVKRKNYKDTRAKKSKLREAEEGEITESSISASDSYESGEEKDAVIMVESGSRFEPCIRIIVEETNIEKLKVGSLFVVTCKGGTLGREGDHAVLIPDINVSKHHAKFVFDSISSSYNITDLGSRNGTWLDGERLSAALQESDQFRINHGAILQIGSTKLLCHVHNGTETCSFCEPGLVQHSLPSSESGRKGPEYREQLQILRKRFGVDGMPPDVFHVPGYEDRAEMRRTTVGSSHSAEKTQTASLNDVIPNTNKGYKMLAKMGWHEGETLGKSSGGVSEPVSLPSNTGKSGLGLKKSPTSTVTASRSRKKKQKILKKTQERYKNIQTVTATSKKQKEN